MKRFALSTLVGVILMAGVISKSQAVEILRWERLPLPVPLIVGQERVIFIDRNMRVGIPTALRGSLRVQSAGGALYLRASTPIDPTRLQLKDINTGEVILLDIDAESAQPHQGSLEPIRIVAAETTGKREGNSDTPTSEDGALASADAPATKRQSPIAVVLTRHAAQSLYAPLRSVEPINDISRVSLRRNLSLETLLPTLPVRAKALVAWRLDDQWVTAIRLTNTSGRWLDLDPRALQGDFVAATFQHPDLAPAGNPSDTTVLYLVTREHGLAESLLPAISRFDTSLNLPSASAPGSEEGSDEK